MMTPITDIVIPDRFRKDHGDIATLAKSIAEVGLLHPVVVTPDGRLIAGERRLRAAQLLGWTEIDARVLTLGNLKRGEFDENEVRKDFAPSERVAILESLEADESEKAKQRERVGLFTCQCGEQFPRRVWHCRECDHHWTEDVEQCKNCYAEVPSVKLTEGYGESLGLIAKMVGTSRNTLKRARAVVQAARQEPERFAPLVEEMDRTGRVNGVFKKLLTAQTAEAIRSEPPPLPVGPFRVIVADPPWHYENRPQDTSHRGALPYPSMSIEEICDLPIAPLGMDDSILWLWTTNAHLPESFRVAEAWGYQYKTILTWIKTRMGLGDWLRGQTEHCLMCVRGRPTVQLTNQTTYLPAPSTEHSAKPAEFYAMVDALCPGSKLELFARTEREGYQRWGAEAPK